MMQFQWQQQFMGQAFAQNSEMMNCKRMIQYIIDRFKKLHVNEESAQKILTEAELLLNNNDIQNSSNKIQVMADDKIIINENSDPEIKKKHTEIVEEAKTIGKNVPFMQDPNMMYNPYGNYMQMGYPSS